MTRRDHRSAVDPAEVRDGIGGSGSPNIRCQEAVNTLYADVAVTTAAGVYVLLGQSTGLGTPNLYATAGACTSILAVDLTQDGKLDLAVTVGGKFIATFTNTGC